LLRNICWYDMDLHKRTSSRRTKATEGGESHAAHLLRDNLAALLKDERGDLPTYLAQGILALAALSLTGAVMVAFTGAGSKELDPLHR